MKAKLTACVLLMALGLFASATVACPKESKGATNKAQTVTKAKAGLPCAHKCVPPCDPANCNHRCDPAKCGRSAGGDKVAMTVAAGTEDGRSEPTESRKKAGSKPCGGKKAALTADTPAKKPCSGHKATKVADKSNVPPCHAKKAALTADTPAKKPCSGHKATTVADKSDVPPCHAKGAATAAHASKGCGKGCCKKAGKLAAHKGEKGSVIICPLTGKPIAEKDCPLCIKVEAVLASMPAMSYRVDGEVTRCSKSAASMAEKAHKPVEYVVGEKVLTDKGEATAKLVSLLDEEAESLQSMQFVAGGKCHGCPMTAKSVAKKSKTSVAYRVGGVDFDKKENAEKALEAVHAAAAAVRVSYKVDGKSYCCDKMAGASAKKTGKKMLYVVGDEETGCEKTANLKLAEAKIRKIVETAVVAASGSTSSPS